MSLEQLLREQKGAVMEAWLDCVLQAYPPEAARFLASEPDPFANPLGQALRRDLDGLLDGLVTRAGDEQMRPFLEEAVRIGAVQGGPPSEAVRFLFALKSVVRGALAGAAGQERITPDELWAFDSRIDALALTAFDLYMECRERICQLRVDEVKKSTFRLLQKAQLLAADEDTGAGGGPSSRCPAHVSKVSEG